MAALSPLPILLLLMRMGMRFLAIATTGVAKTISRENIY